MDSLEEAMIQLLREKMKILIERISSRYHIREEDLFHLLQDNDEPPESIIQATDETPKDEKLCNHKFTKGKRIGMTCLQKINSIHVGKCSKHQPKKSKSKTDQHEDIHQSTHLITASDDELSIPETFNNLSIALHPSDDEFQSE